MRVLVVDDDPGIRWVLQRVLEEEGVDVLQAGSLAEAKEADDSSVDLVFLDVYLPDGNGVEALKEKAFQAPVVLLTAETTFAHAEQAYQAGAMDCLPKPFDLRQVRALVRRLGPPHLAQSLQAGRLHSHEELIVGRSPAMQRLFHTFGRLAASDLTVLITGETGTGKGLLARVLHEHSHRRHGPFVAINAAAAPADLLEAELFGYERGALTGADCSRPGRFEQADTGTLFLDEIGDIPMSLQVKLLRVLEEGVVMRIGSRTPKPVNVRLLAATHQNLQEKIKEGSFREDLYYRLHVIPVQIPPLRERRDDIRELAEYFLHKAAEELKMNPPVLMDEAVGLLENYDWPGNVRELKNVMRRLAILTPGAAITLSDVALAIGNREDRPSKEESIAEAVTRCMKAYLQGLGFAEPKDLHRHLMEQVEPALLRLVLERTAGNQIKAARILGLNRNTVRKLLRQYNIDAASFRSR